MTEARERIDRAVSEAPGIHFNRLVQELDLAPGQVQYHVRKLCREDRVIDESLYGRTHYYPPEFDDWERSVLALARRETTRDVLLYLLTEGSARPNEVTDALDIARSTLSYHVDRMLEAGLVEKCRDDDNRVTLVPTRPEDTLELLREVHPSLPARMTDRFERLVDNLLGP